jgi:hypothetical protein
VAIVTGLARATKNTKLGSSALSIYILAKPSNPLEASFNGNDAHVCGDCALRWFTARGAGHVLCNVSLQNAPLSIWRAWRAGRYPRLTSLDCFAGRFIRWGSYGDPSHIPFSLIAKVNALASSWTGYTHQWRNPLLGAYKQFLMASVNSPSEQIEATAMGWRTYRVIPRGTWRFRDEIDCPASKASGHKTDCSHCRLCAGNAKRGARNIAITDSGPAQGHAVNS